MSLLSDMIVGSSGSSSSKTSQQGTTTRGPTGRMQMPYDQAIRAIIGQMAKPPETAISAPTQQAASLMQGFASQPMGGSLLGAGMRPNPVPGNFQPTSQTGQPQAGLQSRQDLGLPDRSSYFQFMPSVDDISKLGLPPMRAGTPAQTKANKAIDRTQQRIDKRSAAGKPHAKADSRLQRLTAKKDRLSEVTR